MSSLHGSFPASVMEEHPPRRLCWACALWLGQLWSSMQAASQKNETGLRLIAFMNGYIIVNTFSNATDSILRSAEFVVCEDEFRWKWVAIALHHALYSTAIAALEHHLSPQLWKKGGGGKDQDKGHLCQVGNAPWMKSRTEEISGTPAYRIIWEPTDERPTGDHSSEPLIKKALNPTGKEQLISLWTALARVMDGHYWMGSYAISSPLKLSDDGIRRIVWLSIEVRNNLAHFQPKINAIFVPDICQAGLVILKALRFLIFESQTILPPQDESVLRSVYAALKLLEEKLKCQQA